MRDAEHTAGPGNQPGPRGERAADKEAQGTDNEAGDSQRQDDANESEDTEQNDSDNGD